MKKTFCVNYILRISQAALGHYKKYDTASEAKEITLLTLWCHICARCMPGNKGTNTNMRW
jgi:hypothetical protein